MYYLKIILKSFLPIIILLFISKPLFSQSWEWAVQEGENGLGKDVGFDICLDDSNNVYVSGGCNYNCVFGIDTIDSGYFLAKYDSTGAYKWVRLAVDGMSGIGFERNAISIDGDGNVYWVGTFSNSITFETTTLVSDGYSDIYIAKYSRTGNLVWANKAGGVFNDCGNDIFVKNIPGVEYFYITGLFNDVATFGSGGPTVTSAGSCDIFLAKYNTIFGGCEWVLREGGTSSEEGKSLCMDSFGDIIIIGDFYGTTEIGDSTFYTLGGKDIFLAKYDDLGTFLGALHAGGNNSDYGNSVCVDNDDNIYLTGTFQDDLSFGNITLNSYGYYDIFIVKYGASGPEWAKHAGGADGGDDCGWGICCDESDFVYITGTCDNQATFENITLSLPGNNSTVYISKYHSSGVIKWVGIPQPIAGPWGFYAEGNGIIASEHGDVFITGYFAGGIVFGNTALATVILSNQEDIFIAKYCDYDLDLQNINVGIGNTECWEADSIIYAGGNTTIFTAESGSDVTLTAGNKIFLKDGTHLKNGCDAHIHIGGSCPPAPSPIVSLTSNNEYRNKKNNNDKNIENFIHIYPNPVQDQLIIELEQEAPGNSVQFIICDITGEELINKNLGHNCIHRINTSGISGGLYLLKVIRKGEATVKKFIKY